MKIYILLIFVLIASVSYGQAGSVIMPGNTLKITAENDTLWVLKNAQLLKSITIAKQFEVAKERIILFEKKIDLLESQTKEKDDLSNILKKDRDFYKAKWDSSEKDLTKALDFSKSQARKAKIYKSLMMVGVPLAFILGAIIF